MSLFLKRSTVSRSPPGRGACRAGQFLLPPLQIPGILAVLFPDAFHLDERCSPLAQAPAWWRGGNHPEAVGCRRLRDTQGAERPLIPKGDGNPGVGGVSAPAPPLGRHHVGGARDAVGANSEIPGAREAGDDPALRRVHHGDAEGELSESPLWMRMDCRDRRWRFLASESRMDCGMLTLSVGYQPTLL
jgi:hypothetical protein